MNTRSSDSRPGHPPIALGGLKMELPKPFSGGSDKLRSFKQAFDILFNIYADDLEETTMLNMVVSCLEGPPRTWYASQVAIGSAPADVDALWDKLQRNFGNPFEKSDALSKLVNLRQGSTSCEDHNLKFIELVGIAERTDNEEIRAMYLASLRFSLQSQLRKEGVTDVLEDMLERARELELCEKPPPSRPAHIPAAVSVPRRSGGPRGPLSAAEKQRRRDNNLCLYCGGAGHFQANCPRLPARNVASSAVADTEESVESLGNVEARH